MIRIDRTYFDELKSSSGEEFCRKRNCSFNSEDNTYRVEVWNRTFLISPDAERIEDITDTGVKSHEYFTLFVIYYLLHIPRIELQGEWISEKDLAGGPTFFRGPHLVPTHLISDVFANDLEGFINRCTALGGLAVDMGDAAFTFNITPEIPVTVLYWLGDEDFPAEAKVLYDRSISGQLPLDLVYALAVGVCHRLAAG